MLLLFMWINNLKIIKFNNINTIDYNECTSKCYTKTIPQAKHQEQIYLCPNIYFRPSPYK